MTVDEMKQEAVEYLGRLFKQDSTDKTRADSAVVHAAVEVVTTLEAQAQNERVLRGVGGGEVKNSGAT